MKTFKKVASICGWTAAWAVTCFTVGWGVGSFIGEKIGGLLEQ